MPSTSHTEIKAELISFDATHTLFAPHPSVGRIYTLVSSDFGIDADEHEITSAFHDVWSETKAGAFGLVHNFSASDEGFTAPTKAPKTGTPPYFWAILLASAT